MTAQKELLRIEGGSILIIQVSPEDETHSEHLVAALLQEYMYAPKPYAATIIDLSLGGYFVSTWDLTAMLMSLPPGSSERTGCAVVATPQDAPRLQQLLMKVKVASFVRVFTSFDDALKAVSVGVANRPPDLPPLFVQSSRAASNSIKGPVLHATAGSKPRVPTTLTPNKKGPMVFMAHASEDKETIRHLNRKLKDYGFQTWLDEVDLIPGQNWQIAISDAIRHSDVFLACMSSRAVGKLGFVQRELRMALAAYGDRPSESIYLIPVRLDECDVPDLQIPELGVRLRDFHWVDLWKDGGFDALLNAISTATSIRQPSKVATPGVRIVDVSFVELIPDDQLKFPAYIEETTYVRLDIKIRSTSSEVAFIKRLTLSVEHVWALEGFAFTGAAVPPSAEYDLVLPVEPTPFQKDIQIAHSLEPNAVDRFAVTIYPERSAHLFVARLRLFYDEDDKMTTSERVLFATRSGARTWPTASTEVLAETDGIASRAAQGTMWDRWPVARRRIESNNRVRNAIADIPGTRNRAVASFERGEPVIEGFRG